jgi:hypothetical protein
VINFRYHVVSLTAVFLALAIGLVVGTTALNGPISESLKDQVDELGKQNQELRDRINHLEDDVDKKEDFATLVAPEVLANKLATDRVLILTLPSGAGYVEDVTTMLTTGGATVTGTVQINDKFIDPAHNDELLDLAHTSLPASVTGSLPTNTDGVEASSALLAAVLLARTPPVPDTDLQKVLSAYKAGEYVTVTGAVSGPAAAVVLVSGPPVADKEAARKNAAVVTLVDQFDQAGKLVVAANGLAGDGNVVAAVRADPQLKTTVSTVDNVSTPQGRLATALAVADQIDGREVGHYGIGDGTTLLPKLAP